MKNIYFIMSNKDNFNLVLRLHFMIIKTATTRFLANSIVYIYLFKDDLEHLLSQIFV